MLYAIASKDGTTVRSAEIGYEYNMLLVFIDEESANKFLYKNDLDKENKVVPINMTVSTTV